MLATVTNDDLLDIRKLQPEGWPDIVSEFKFYVNAGFCLPVKNVLGDRIAGIGAAIILGDSAWIAHIIVDKEYRNKGIGSSIVEEIMKKLEGFHLRSYLLIATEMGKSLYEKAGFRVVADYAYFKREIPWNDQPMSEKVLTYKTAHFSGIMELDRKISGEIRAALLYDHLRTSKVYLQNNSVVDKAVLPAENHAGISFLEQNGFVKTPAKGTRMVYGEDVKWKPDKIFNRIGGNLG